MKIATAFFILLVGLPLAQAQTPTSPATNAASSSQAATDPTMTQIRKTVAFIELLCKDGDKEFNVRGTGFWLAYPDARLGPNQSFIYLVTNRHVAFCWNESGHPMLVESIKLWLNQKQAPDDQYAFGGFLNANGNAPWFAPEDSSIDLAVLPIAPDANRFDYKTIPVDSLAGPDFLVQNRITEGEPVFFTGFFYQFPGAKRIEPIVRQGIIAMMPHDKVPFNTGPEKVYLADLHVFGGNSGSPAFIHLGGFRDGAMIMVANDLRLIGVVNANMSEDENFNLELTTTVQGTAKANSGVSTIVPADELKALLDSPSLKGLRDQAVLQSAQKK